MEIVMLVLAISAAILVMACGVWVAVVLIATVARAQRTAASAPDRPASEKPHP
jgi:hypothetical protein